MKKPMESTAFRGANQAATENLKTLSGLVKLPPSRAECEDKIRAQARREAFEEAAEVCERHIAYINSLMAEATKTETDKLNARVASMTAVLQGIRALANEEPGDG